MATAEKQERYTLDVNGVEHTIRLNAEDAEAYKEAFGDKMQPKSKARKSAAANKSRTPANKGAAPSGDQGGSDPGAGGNQPPTA